MPRRPLLPRLYSLALGLLLAACSTSGRSDPNGAMVLRVGYFPNITHSQALIGLARGDFQTALGPQVQIEPIQFNAGPSVIEAMFAGEIDMSYIGPNPAINGYVQSQGEALRIVAGATSGGAALVVRPEAGITTPPDLSGRRLATPQLGNTQDVALRSYLIAHGFDTVERHIWRIGDQIALDLLGIGENRLGDLLGRRAAVGNIVFDAEVAIGPTGIMARREHDAAKGLVLADDIRRGRRRQKATLPDEHAPEAIGGCHLDRSLDHFAIMEAPVTADHQRLALETFE